MQHCNFQSFKPHMYLVVISPHIRSKEALLPSFYQVQHLTFIMVNPAFGWSAGDIVRSDQQHYKDMWGLQGGWRRYVSVWGKHGFPRRLQRYTEQAWFSHLLQPYRNLKYAAEISEQLKLIDAPYGTAGLRSLCLTSSPLSVRPRIMAASEKCQKKITWALNELSAVSGKVAKLKREVCDPLTVHFLELWCSCSHCMYLAQLNSVRTWLME